ncbi:DUF697 domain-containing protein [Stappia sp. TSB10P1A]|uniref:DUF697 domain-containing protein n=1 Tax=Stappia sp. TSB10P1A TaxID=2003585 RepID=UPI00164393C2|nr:DUF697 domain-containing protein [Stappia sp. TSB10P1A]
MSRKLPRTLQRTIHDIRREINAADAEEATGQAAEPATGGQATGQNADPALDAASDAARPDAGGPATAETPRQAEPAGTAQSAVRPEDAPIPPTRALSTRPPAGRDLQRIRARLIIERHSTLAGLAGFVPLPWVDLAAVAALVARMLRELSRCYRVPLDRDRSARITASLLAGVGAPGIASFTTTSLLRMAPGPNLVGMTVTAASAVALTRVIGDVFLEKLERGEPADGGDHRA